MWTEWLGGAFLHVFLYFESIFGVFSSFFRSMPFFCFHIFRCWNFNENIFPRGRMECFIIISWRWQMFRLPRLIFEILSRCVFFFLHTLDRLKPPLYFCLQFSPIVFGRNFGTRAKTMFFGKTFFFYEMCLFSHWVVYAVLLVYFAIWYVRFRRWFIFCRFLPPSAASVPGAVIVHADIFVVFSVFFREQNIFFDRFFAIVISFFMCL